MGTSGPMICSQAFSMLTLIMSLRFTFFKVDFDPSVATSLWQLEAVVTSGEEARTI